MTGQGTLPEDPGTVEEQLAVLRHQVGELAAATRDLPDMRERQKSYGALAQQFAGLRDQTTETEMKLLRRIKAVSEALKKALGEGKVTPPQSPYWADMDEATFRRELTALTDWVKGFLRPNYPGYELKACWANHMEAVWELGMVRAEWTRCFGNADDRRLEDGLWWHNRWLPDALRRLRESIVCPDGECLVLKAAADARKKRLG